MSHFSPTWVHDKYKFYLDKTSLDEKKKLKKYLYKNLVRNIIYSIFIYLFIFIGIFNFFVDIFTKRQFSEQHKFILFNILSILYFVLISGFWGNSRYFIPCIISFSFFFAHGLKYIVDFIKKKKLKSEVF